MYAMHLPVSGQPLDPATPQIVADLRQLHRSTDTI
jgi:hypothetical protein